MTKAVDAIQRPAQQAPREPKRSRAEKSPKKTRVALRRAETPGVPLSRPHPARTKFSLAVGLSFVAVLLVWATTFHWRRQGKNDSLLQSILQRFRTALTSDENTPTVLQNGTVMGASEELHQLKDQVFPQFTETGK